MSIAAVKTACNLCMEPVSLGGIFCFDHPFGELAQCFRAEWLAFSSMTGELDNPAAFISRETSYLLNDLSRCHGREISSTDAQEQARERRSPAVSALTFTRRDADEKKFPALEGNQGNKAEQKRAFLICCGTPAEPSGPART